MLLLLQALALMLVLEGIPYFLRPDAMRQAMLIMANEMTDRNLRIFGLVCMALGVLLLSVLH